MIFLRLSLTLCIIFTHGSLLSQHFHFRNLSQREGVPSSCVYRVFEDSKGYIWYVTDKGIARFDGNKCKHFGPEDGFEEASAFHIVEASDGSIWVLANYYLYTFKKEKFYKVAFHERFSWIDIDKTGKAWLLSLHGNIYQLHTGNHHITPIIKLPGVNPIGAYSLLHLQGETFLIGIAKGTYIINRKSYRKLISSDVYKTLVPPRFFRLSDRILISDQSGIHEADTALRSVKLCPVPELRGSGCIYEDAVSKDLWVGTLQGLFHFPGGEIRRDKSSILLPEHNVIALQKFRDNNFWIGTLDAGVICYNFESVHLDHQEGLPAKGIRFIEKAGDRIYLFAQDTKYYQLEKNKISVHTFPVPTPGIIMGVFAVNDSAIYLTGSDAYWLAEGKLHKYGNSFLHIKSSNKKQFIVNMTGVAWVFGTKDSIVSYKRRAQVRQFTEEHKIELIKDYPLLVDDDYLYYTERRGILKISRRNDEIRTSLVPIKGHVSDIDKCGDQLLVSTLNNGLFLYGENSFTHLDVINGLPSNFCKEIYIRGKATWVATNKGIAKILLGEKGEVEKIINITSGDYLINDEINDIAFDKGQVYAVTGKGISIFPEDVQPIGSRPVILIEKIQINSVDTTFLPEYHLDYDQNNLLIQFNSPGSRSGNYNLYQGIITKDQSTDTHFYTNGTLQLGSLMPGDYTIRMNVRNVDGLWSSIPSVVRIIIRPPFWKTWWFILSLICFCCGVVGYIIFNHTRSLRKNTEFRMKLVESDLRSLRLHMNPHFIFNSLTSLQSYILTNKTDEADNYISQFSSLIRAIMNYSVKGEIRLNEEVELLKKYIALEMVRFKDQFDYIISIAPDIPASDILIPSLLIQPFVENAIKHGLTGMKRKGILKVHFYTKSGALICRVEDNGRGRNNPSANKPRTRDHQPTGISFTMERIRLLVPDTQNRIVDITDLYENDQPSGTRIDILIPIL